MAFEKDHFLARERKRIALERSQQMQSYEGTENVLVLEPRPKVHHARPLTHIPDDIRTVNSTTQRIRDTAIHEISIVRPLNVFELTLVYVLQVIAYAAPILLFSYILYLNVLPFGYSHESQLQVGSPKDLTGELHLLPSPNLSSRITSSDGTTFRELNGFGSATLALKSALHGAIAEVSIQGENSFLLPSIVSTTTNASFTNIWDFTKKIPEDLNGSAYVFDGCARFDGSNVLEMASTSASFENGPLSIFALWQPEDSFNDYQQIIGHYNWELMQNSDSVIFQVGRMDAATSGPFFSVKYRINDDFFGQKHSALATYTPGTQGYIELAIDGKIVGRTYIGTSTISTEYNQRHNLSFGEKIYIGAPFKGCIYSAGISELGSPELQPQQMKIAIPDDADSIVIPFAGYNAKLESIKVRISQP